MRLLRLGYRRIRGLTWLLFAIALVGVFVLGTTGVRQHLAVTEPDQTYSPTTVVFFVLQMLGLDWGAVPEPVSWQLETARVLAVFVFLGAIIKTVLAFLKRPLEGFWLKHLARGHSIVCGLGDKGSRIARQLLDRGELVVVIERNEALSAVDELRKRGAIVVVGDALHPDIMRSTGVARCRRLLATCGDDAMNLGVGAIAAAATKQRAGPAVPTIHVHCMDPVAFDLFRLRDATTAPGETTFETKRFNIPENAARLLLDTHPLDRETIGADSPRFIQLITIGRSSEAESILIHTAALAHCANLSSPRITVIAPDAAHWSESLRFRFPQIMNACALEFVQRDLCHPETRFDIERLLSDENAVSTLVIAPENGQDVLTIAARLPAVAAARGARVFIRTCHTASLLDSSGDTTEGPQFVPFDTLQRACELDLVLQDGLDRQAKVMHAAYEKKALADGRSPITTPSIRPWALLAETYRQSNRRNADHIPVKLRAVGRAAVPANATSRPESAFSAEEIEILARMEHARWNADRWLDGWQFGIPRNDALKIHDNLVPWEHLDERTKDYDREAVRQIPAMLAEVGKVVVASD
jgi:hypothetical protein